MKGFSNMTPEAVAIQAIRALGRRRSLVVTGWMNKLSTLLGGAAPKRAAAWVSGKLVARTRMDHLRS
jgi:hypothetical protein